ncbi:restriction endonuclease subunit S [Pseudomonas veronii]|uniref:restriction endonuclease subunit S n=1 Tax=Pseudomonas veronii TaxID=76761 RepID=UPI002D77807D|nr:restriction endonuclease subunit S [Pseudomonas veronii]WRU62486.1 restriction endonuclease subunit S [Pseudomonas veronii]
MNAQVRPGYRLTDIGVYPIEWDVKKLGEITTLMTNGFVGTATSAYVKSDDGVLYIQGFNVEPNSFNYRGIKRVSATFHTQNQKSCLRTGDLLTIQTGDIGTTTIVPPSLAGANCHALVISRLDLRRSSPEFYCQYFNSDKGRAAFKVIETGTTMKHLNVGDMVRLLVPSPPLDEQQAIARALFDIDALIAGLDQLIAKKSDIKQATMQQLLTGQQRLPGFSGEWKIKRLGEIGVFLKGSGVRRDQSLSGDLPCIRYGEIYTIHNDYIREFKSYISVAVSKDATLIECGDIMFAGSGETKEDIGKCVSFIDDIEAYAGGDIVILRPKNVDSLFLGYALNTPRIIRQKASRGQGDAVVHISANALATIEVLMPNQAEQTAIATILSDMDSELATLETRAGKARQLKQGMMQELLTGRIRLT